MNHAKPYPEMNGSLMLERWHDTENRVVELTFRADGDIECCYYNQSKVVLYVRSLPKDILIRKSFPLWLCEEEFPHERMFNSQQPAESGSFDFVVVKQPAKPQE